MSEESRQLLQHFFGPLQRRLRLRFRSKSAWDDFVPYRRLSELVEYTRGLDPDDLMYAVAEGADNLTNTLRIREGSPANQALEKLIERARVRANRLRPAWQAHLDYVERVAPRARMNAIVKTALFVSGGNLTLGAALREGFLSLFDLDGVDEAAKEASRWANAIDAFNDGIFDDFENLVLPALTRQFG